MKRIRGLLAAAAMLAMVGCIETEVVVTVRPDGSGTVQQTVLMSKTVVEQMQALSRGMGGDEGTNAFDIYKPEELEAKAAEYGASVTLVKSEPYENDKGTGYRAVYAFDDINELQLDQNPGSSAPSTGQPGEEQAPQEYVGFSFTKGKVATLKVRRPQEQESTGGEDDSDSDAEAPDADDIDEEALAQVTKMFDGMRVAVIIEIDGSITRTNATHRKGNRVTLLDLDFGKVLGDADKLKQFAKVNPKTVEEAKKVLKDVPGIKVDLNEELVISFK